MNTKLLLLLGAAVAVASLTSCDINAYPGAYGYGSYYSRPSYYGSNYYRPLLTYSGYGGGYSRPYNYGYSGYSRPYSSFSNFGYNRGTYCAPMIGHPHYSSFGSGCSSFGGSSSFGHQGFCGSSFGGGYHHLH